MEIAPKNDAEWTSVGDSLVALAEASYLLMMDGRAVDRADWTTMSRAHADAALTAMKAVEAKDPELLLTYGSEVNTTCDNCHQRYQRE